MKISQCLGEFRLRNVIPRICKISCHFSFLSSHFCVENFLAYEKAIQIAFLSLLTNFIMCLKYGKQSVFRERISVKDVFESATYFLLMILPIVHKVMRRASHSLFIRVT